MWTKPCFHQKHIGSGYFIFIARLKDVVDYKTGAVQSGKGEWQPKGLPRVSFLQLIQKELWFAF